MRVAMNEIGKLWHANRRHEMRAARNWWQGIRAVKNGMQTRGMNHKGGTGNKRAAMNESSKE